jgi:hypothetical protein
MNELHEKAQRLVDAHDQMEAMFPMLASKGDALKDAVEVAKAYLSEHLVDDEEPPTAFFFGLSSDECQRRFGPAVEKNHVIVYMGYSSDGCGTWCACVNDTPYAQSVKLKSKGQFRLLCRALGIELKEPACT